MVSYPARIEPSEGRFLATFRDVPAAIAGGATRPEALAHARAVLALTLMDHAAKGRPPPVATPALAGEVVVELDPARAAGLILQMEMTRQGLSIDDLARRLKTDEHHIRRILSGRAGSRRSAAVLRALDLPPPDIAAPDR